MEPEYSEHESFAKSSHYGLIAVASVVFNINTGQTLEYLYPSNAPYILDEAKKSLAQLALPHDNTQKEGDSQFVIRFRADRVVHSEIDLRQPQFLLGFVLFRRRRDQKKLRGYTQRSFVIIASKPYLDLYQRIQHAIGPSFFQYGPRALISAYHEILKWEQPLLNRVALFSLTSTKFSCVIPRICDYRTTGHVEENNHNCPDTSAHILSDDEEGDWVLINSTGEEDTVMGTPGNASMQMEELARIENDFEGIESDLSPADFIVTDKNPCSSSPSLSDLLITRGSHKYTDFEVIGLYSTFRGCEQQLWLLWQFAIIGERLLILAPHARKASHATLAFTSLIAPIQFQADYRPLYSIYEADFEAAYRNNDPGSRGTRCPSVIGTTSPFFSKALKDWPAALIFPSTKPSTVGFGVSIRLKAHVHLDDLEEAKEITVVRRCSRLVFPDTSILRQLVPSSKSTSSERFYTPPESDEIINNAILRKHFRQLTEHFLRPFDQYFGIWKAKRVTSVCLYQDIEECMKPFDKTEFIQSINPQTLPTCIRRSKWKQLYLQFIDSPHFDPWFMYRRQLCIRHFDSVMRALRGKIDQEALTRTPCGKHQDLESCANLFNEVQEALDKEESRQERDEEQLATIQNHLKIIGNQMNYLKNTEL